MIVNELRRWLHAKEIVMTNKIVVEVLVPKDVPAQERPQFEAAIVEFLFGVDRPRAEVAAALAIKGINPNGLATTFRKPVLGLCPDPDALEFVPGPALTKMAASKGMAFVGGGSVELEFQYDLASKMTYPPDALYVNLKVPKEIAQDITHEVEGEIAQALFGDCDITATAQSYLRAHGIANLMDVSGAALKGRAVPPTTRVSAAAAARLRRGGLNVDQFGKLEVHRVTALP
jgi:hypothetical protein